MLQRHFLLLGMGHAYQEEMPPARHAPCLAGDMPSRRLLLLLG